MKTLMILQGVKFTPWTNRMLQQKKIAEENNLSEKTIRSVGRYSNAIDLAETVCSGINNKIFPKTPEKMASHIGNE